MLFKSMLVFRDSCKINNVSVLFSLSESYFTVKGTALILPQSECARKTSKKSHGGKLFY